MQQFANYAPYARMNWDAADLEKISFNLQPGNVVTFIARFVAIGHWCSAEERVNGHMHESVRCKTMPKMIGQLALNCGYAPGDAYLDIVKHNSAYISSTCDYVHWIYASPRFAPLL